MAYNTFNNQWGFQNGYGYPQPQPQQPYQMPMPQPPQPPREPIPQPPKTPQITGRYVNNPNEIVAQEVPMDGSVGIFPQMDFSCIYAKAWNSDGTIQTVKFVPEPNTEMIVPADNSAADILDNINKRLGKIEKLLYKKPYHNNKKEEKTDA